MRLLFLAAAVFAVGLYAAPAQACGAKKAAHAGGGGCGSGCGAGDCAAGCAGGCAGGCGGWAKAHQVDRSTYATPSKVAWRDLDQGLSEARAKGLPVLVHFSFGTQCDHCVQLEKRVYNDPTLASVLNGGGRAVPVRVPLWAMTAGERALGEKVGYGEACYLALITPQGEVVRSSDGRSLATHGIPSAEALVQTLEPLVN